MPGPYNCLSQQKSKVTDSFEQIQKEPRAGDPGSELSYIYFGIFMKLHHAHSALRHRRHSRIFRFDLSNNGFCRQQCGSYACRILKSAPCHFGRVDNTGVDHVDINFVQCVESNARFAFADFIDNYSAFQTCICRNME